MLVAMQDEILCEYGRIASISTEPQAASGAFQPGLGAQYPFLCDEGGALAAELDLLELTDVKHSPFLPFTFLLDSTLVVRQIWCGFWYWGNPTPEELRRALRDVTRAEQPTYDAQGVWSGAVPAGPRPGSSRRSSGSARTPKGAKSGGEPTTAPSRTSAPRSAARRSTGDAGSSTRSSVTATPSQCGFARSNNAGPLIGNVGEKLTLLPHGPLIATGWERTRLPGGWGLVGAVSRLRCGRRGLSPHRRRNDWPTGRNWPDRGRRGRACSARRFSHSAGLGSLPRPPARRCQDSSWHLWLPPGRSHTAPCLASPRRPVGADSLADVLDCLRRQPIEGGHGELDVLELRVLLFRMAEPLQALGEQHDRRHARAGDLRGIVQWAARQLV